MKRKLLLISYNYYPMVNPRALRWTSIAEEMVNQGYEVHVVCSKVSGEAVTEVVKGVNIHRVGIRSQAKPGAKESQSDQGVGFLKFSLRLIYNNLVKYFIWPDSNAFWIKRAVTKCKEIIFNNEINKMISISHPFSGHVVGNKVWNCNKDMKWVMDIGDPFAFLEYVNINNKFLFNKFNYSYEKKVIKNSYKQSVTTPLTTEEYLKQGFDCKDSMIVIPPLLRGGYEKCHELEGDEVNWIFVGTLYKKIRSPRYLLKLFEAITRKDKRRVHKLHFYGKTKMCAEDFLPYSKLIGKSIILHGLVSPDIAKQALKQSSILINIGNKTSYQLPSKLVEYIALGKRIINIKSIDNDSSEEFLKNYENSITLDESKDVDSQSQALLEKINSQEYISNESDLNLYSKDTISRAYISLFE